MFYCTEPKLPFRWRIQMECRLSYVEMLLPFFFSLLFRSIKMKNKREKRRQKEASGTKFHQNSFILHKMRSEQYLLFCIYVNYYFFLCEILRFSALQPFKSNVFYYLLTYPKERIRDPL